MGVVENLLKKRKTAIVKGWFDAVVKTYSPDTAGFLKNQMDPFANPVGVNTANSLESLFDSILTGGCEPSTIESHLDSIIRIRAIQNFTPSQALSFLFSLKTVVRDCLRSQMAGDVDIGSLLAFESRIDALALCAFDIYMKCREKIYDIKATEERNRTFSAFHRAGLIQELPDDEPGARETKIM